MHGAVLQQQQLQATLQRQQRAQKQHVDTALAELRQQMDLDRADGP